jgi:hypothetical protein
MLKWKRLLNSKNIFSIHSYQKTISDDEFQAGIFIGVGILMEEM